MEGDPGACSVNHIRVLTEATTALRNKYKSPLPRVLPTSGNRPFAENQLLNLLGINYSCGSISVVENRNFFLRFPNENNTLVPSCITAGLNERLDLCINISFYKCKNEVTSTRLLVVLSRGRAREKVKSK